MFKIIIWWLRKYQSKTCSYFDWQKYVLFAFYLKIWIHIEGINVYKSSELLFDVISTVKAYLMHSTFKKRTKKSNPIRYLNNLRNDIYRKKTFSTESKKV